MANLPDGLVLDQLRAIRSDLLIAAHAVSKDMTLVTSNVREFQRLKGLAIEDWR